MTRAGRGRRKGPNPPACVNICASGALSAAFLCVPVVYLFIFSPLRRQGRASCAEREKQ